MSSDDTGPDVGSDAGPESVSAPEPGPEPPVCPPAEPLPREFTRLTPVGSLTIRCARGYGLAVSMALGVLATTVSDDDVVVVHTATTRAGHPKAGALSSGGAVRGGGGAVGEGEGEGDCDGEAHCPAPPVIDGFVRTRVLGGSAWPPDKRFRFQCNGASSGCLAFTCDGAAGPPLLLVTDAGHDAVHLVDVVAGTHAGFLTEPGSIAGPRAVTASPTLLAVSAWKFRERGDPAVHLYSAATWAPLAVVGAGTLASPWGLRVSRDQRHLVVADSGHDRVTVLAVEGGGVVGHLATGLHAPVDVQECAEGWLVACRDSHSVVLVPSPSGGLPCAGAWGPGVEPLQSIGGQGASSSGPGHGDWGSPVGLALVPELGLVVRELKKGGGVQVLA
jgi:hypothetical protein